MGNQTNQTSGRGGRRPGAGRRKGSISKSTKAILEAAENGGDMPLAYMLAVMRDKDADKARRDEMAKAAAPYLHPKLATKTIQGPDGGPVRHDVRVTIVKPGTVG